MILDIYFSAGENCWMGKRIVSASGPIIRDDDYNCRTTCECPKGSNYDHNTEAQCFTVCKNKVKEKSGKGKGKGGYTGKGGQRKG